MTTHSVIPGTVHLVDLQHNLAVKHAKGDLGDVILVPKPSNDPDDPLNWSKRRKLLSTVCMCVYVTMTGLCAAAVYSIIVPIAEDTGLTINGEHSINFSRCLQDLTWLSRSQRRHRLSISRVWLGLRYLVNTEP